MWEVVRWYLAAGSVDRAVGVDAVLAPNGIVLLSVTGSCVDCASSLLQRDMVGEDANGIALEK